LKRSVQYPASTIKFFTLSFGVINFQTISKLKNSTSTCEYIGKAHTCKYSGHTFRQTKPFGAKCFQKMPEIRHIAKLKYLSPNTFNIRQISGIWR